MPALPPSRQCRSARRSERFNFCWAIQRSRAPFGIEVDDAIEITEKIDI